MTGVRTLLVASVLGALAGAPSAFGAVTLVAPDEAVTQGQHTGFTAETTKRRGCTLTTTSPAGRRDSYDLRLLATKNVVVFTVARAALPGSWRLTLKCGREKDRGRTRVKASRGRRASPLVVRATLDTQPKHDDDLDDSSVPSELEQPAGKDLGGPDPVFHRPFPCGEEWVASSYPGHGDASDWNASEGDFGRPVVASADGVAFPQPAGRLNGGYGNYIIVVHSGGWTTLYAHLSAYAVGAGETVQRGQRIGAVGNTGRSYGAHLHYEQRLNGASQPQRFSDGPIRLGPNRSDNCGAPPPPPPPPPPPSDARRVITVDNRVTNGAGMREDPTPARLTTQPVTFCGRRGCNINGTERASGATYDAAICQTQGERTTNGDDGNPSDDNNAERYESTLYYGVRLSNGVFGYVSEVWIREADRHGLGLPAC